MIMCSSHTPSSLHKYAPPTLYRYLIFECLAAVEAQRLHDGVRAAHWPAQYRAVGGRLRGASRGAHSVHELGDEAEVVVAGRQRHARLRGGPVVEHAGVGQPAFIACAASMRRHRSTSLLLPLKRSASITLSGTCVLARVLLVALAAARAHAQALLGRCCARGSAARRPPAPPSSSPSPPAPPA
jgi:hypothetical protein